MADIGRPSLKDDPETITKLEQAFAMDCSVLEACSFAGIAPKTYYEWIKTDEDFSNRISQLRQRPFLKARNAIIKGLDEPEFALKYMERKKRKEFALRIEEEHSGEVKIDLDNDQLKKIAEEVLHG